MTDAEILTAAELRRIDDDPVLSRADIVEFRTDGDGDGDDTEEVAA